MSKIQKNSMKLDDNGLTEMFGYILLIGIVVAGLSIIILMTMPTVNSSKDTAQFNHIEQAFTTADSRISKARFSTSIYQETPFQLNDGKIIIDGSDANSWIEVYRDSDDPANLISHTTLGTIKCVTDQGEVAYQGGGVWEKYPDGGSIMISPPDFGYNGETLTLPIMSLKGSESLTASSGNKVQIGVRSDPAGFTQIYPRYNADPALDYSNPVDQGRDIIIKIKSDYAVAWRDFIRERTKATAELDPLDSTIVKATLKTGREPQHHAAVDGMNTQEMILDEGYTPVTLFTFDLVKRNNGRDYQSSWRPADDSLNPFLEIETIPLHGGGPSKQNVQVRITYTDTAHGILEIFSTVMQFDDTGKIHIDMLDNDNMIYGDEDGDMQVDNRDRMVTATSASWGSNPYAADSGTIADLTDGHEVPRGDDTKTLADVTQHYLWLMASEHSSIGPEYSAFSNSKGHSEGHIKYNIVDSKVHLEYNSKEDLKYLYVTSGDIDATLSSSR
ncbi:DUF7289 family protein [Methanocella sp. MCL-LM]|uniref:DUF7289 family protein n=1 Tax=Methanocella sp. MCL-LM TaxID=3412035 RepID=UPI003C71D32E